MASGAAFGLSPSVFLLFKLLLIILLLHVWRPGVELGQVHLFRSCILAGLVFLAGKHGLSIGNAWFGLPDQLYLENLLHILGQGAFWAGLGAFVGIESKAGFDWRSWFLWLGVVIFGVFGIIYQIMLPSQYAPLAVHYGALAFFPVSSGVLALTIFYFGFSRFQGTSAAMLLVLGSGVGLWFLEDLCLFLEFHFESGLQYAAWAFGALALAPMGWLNQQIREGIPPREGEQNGSAYLGRLWLLAFLFPLLHFLGNRLNLFSENTITEREWVALAGLIALSGVGALQILFLKKKKLLTTNNSDMLGLQQAREDLQTRVEEEQVLLAMAKDNLKMQIAKRQEVEKGLKQSQERFRALVETMNEGMFVVSDERVITYVNIALCRMLGYTASEVSGRKIDEFFDEDNRRILDREYEKRKAGRDEPFEICWTHKDGFQTPTMVSPRGIRDGKGALKGDFSVVTDISDQKRVQEEMRVMAQYDALTTLPNRTLLNERLEQAITRSKRFNQQLAVLFMDLDRFKRINDSLGHRIGDLLLLSVAMRLKNCVREVDTVARINSDEFAILLSDIESTMAAVVVIEKIQESFQASFKIEGYEVSITPSIGVSIFPHDGRDSATLLKNADAAMYHVKTQGRNNYQFYTKEMNQAALHRLNLENRLRVALEQNELQLFYQPKLNLKTGIITGVEALARWRHPELGLIVPDKFIPIAEDTGLILPLGEWVMEEACRQAKEWQDLGLPPIKVAINLSPMQFGSETLPAQVVSALAKSNLQPEFLELEITESLVMEDAERTIRLLAHLKAMGISITIDDFGTGYSSLNYLKRFPIDCLKIDRTFVRDIETNRSDEAIVRAVIAMSHGMKMTVVAEGVEKKNHLKHLKVMGCDYAQGFYISPPVDMDQLKAMVSNKKAANARDLSFS